MNYLDIKKIISYHGLLKGTRRIFDEIRENHLFDLLNNCTTRKIKFSEDYKNDIFYNQQKHKWYQPTYYTPLLKVGKELKKIVPMDSNVLCIDLGAGYGKALMILNKVFKNHNFCSLGIEFDISFKKIFDDNLKKFLKKTLFINQKIENVDFHKIIEQQFEESKKNKILIIHNKNSTDENITNLSLLKFLEIKNKLKIKIFYIYSNPEFSHLFKKFNLVYKTKGWHKNYKIKLYQL